MDFDGTIHLGDVLMAVVALILIPAGKALLGILADMRQTVQELSFLVVGTKDRQGLVGDMDEVKKESRRHRNWLMEVKAHLGLKLDDRS